jgi:hypothetical protein
MLLILEDLFHNFNGIREQDFMGSITPGILKPNSNERTISITERSRHPRCHINSSMRCNERYLVSSSRYNSRNNLHVDESRRKIPGGIILLSHHT